MHNQHRDWPESDDGTVNGTVLFLEAIVERSNTAAIYNCCTEIRFIQL